MFVVAPLNLVFRLLWWRPGLLSWWPWAFRPLWLALVGFWLKVCSRRAWSILFIFGFFLTPSPAVFGFSGGLVIIRGDSGLDKVVVGFRPPFVFSRAALLCTSIESLFCSSFTSVATIPGFSCISSFFIINISFCPKVLAYSVHSNIDPSPCLLLILLGDLVRVSWLNSFTGNADCNNDSSLDFSNIGLWFLNDL